MALLNIYENEDGGYSLSGTVTPAIPEAATLTISVDTDDSRLAFDCEALDCNDTGAGYTVTKIIPEGSTTFSIPLTISNTNIEEGDLSGMSIGMLVVFRTNVLSINPEAGLRVAVVGGTFIVVRSVAISEVASGSDTRSITAQAGLGKVSEEGRGVATLSISQIESVVAKRMSFVSKGFGLWILSDAENVVEAQEVKAVGSILTTVVPSVLETKVIDGAIVSKAEGPFSRESMFAKSKDELIKASGTILNVSPQVDEIQRFNTYTRSIPQLSHYKFKKLAIVGTPCQIYTIRCMQALGVTPSEHVEITLGLFCYHNFLFEKSQIEKFEKDFKVKFEDIVKINIKEDLILKLKDKNSEEKIIHIPFDKLGNYIRPACHSCIDFTNIYSDISFGGLGSPDKFTTVIPRTEKGVQLLQKALDKNIIKSLKLDENANNRIKSLISKFSESKIGRRNEFMKKLK